jgi:hypothetical protein
VETRRWRLEGRRAEWEGEIEEVTEMAEVEEMEAEEMEKEVEEMGKDR